MTGSEWAVIVVAIVGLIGALLSARSARAASKYSTDASIANAKAQAETEAYYRARKMDVETIERQDKEIRDLTSDYEDLMKRFKQLQKDNNELRQAYYTSIEEIQSLKRHVTRLEENRNIR